MPGHREQEQGWAGRRGELLAHAAPRRLREGALPRAWLLHVTRLAILIFLPPILEGIFWFFSAASSLPSASKPRCLSRPFSTSLFSGLRVGSHGFLTRPSASPPQTAAFRDHSTRLAEKKTALVETMS